MPGVNSHEEVEFVAGPRGETFNIFSEAAEAALLDAIGQETPVQLNVLIYGEAGARWWGGDKAVERYRSDPEASVFERFEIGGRSLGMIA
jgi:hypothetical protein